MTAPIREPGRPPAKRGILDIEKAKQIRRLENQGNTMKSIAKQFGISESMVRKVCKYESWA